MSQPLVKVYTGGFCPYCVAAKRMLKQKGVEFKELQVDRDPELRQRMEALSGRQSVPQIFIGDLHVGGYDDMAALNRKGELDRLLGLDKTD